MNRNLALFLAATAIGLSVVGVVAANAQSKVAAPALVRVDIHRGAPCTGVAHYTVTPADAQLQTDLGARDFALPIIVPCARLDAVDAVLALPDNRAGKLAVQTQDISLAVRDDATCFAEVRRILAAVDVDVAAAVGARAVQQRVDPISCARLSQAVVGALVVKGGDIAVGWPSSVITLPIPLEP